MNETLIQYYYCVVGWSAKAIAKELNESESVVRKVIEDEGFQPKAKAGESGLIPYDTNIAVQNVKTAELQKQSVIAPLVAEAEIRLLGKVIAELKYAQQVDIHTFDGEERMSPEKMKTLAQTIQILKQSDTVKTLTDPTNGNSGVTVQILNSFQA